MVFSVLYRRCSCYSTQRASGQITTGKPEKWCFQNSVVLNYIIFTSSSNFVLPLATTLQASNDNDSYAPPSQFLGSCKRHGEQATLGCSIVNLAYISHLWARKKTARQEATSPENKTSHTPNVFQAKEFFLVNSQSESICLEDKITIFRN